LAGPLNVLVTHHEMDLLDPAGVRAAVEAAAPDLVFHLAAFSSVAASWRDPEAAYRTNVLGQLHLLEAIHATSAKPRILVAGTSEEYGVPDAVPIAEDAPLKPQSPYAVSKAAQDLMAYQYWVGRQLPCIRVRAFNHIGPGQAPGFVAADFAMQIAEAEAGQRAPVMRVGNLAAERDFSDVRDVVRAYYWLAQKGHPGEAYNVGSGVARPVQYLLDTLCGKSTVGIRVEVDPERYRPVDVPQVYADISKLRHTTGWVPETPLDQSLGDVLDYWRSRVSF